MPFQKGQSGNPAGMKKGTKRLPTIKVKDLAPAVNARALDMLETGLGKAWSVLDEALDDGDTDVARWLIDRVVSKGQSMLPESIEIKLDSIDNVMIAAQAVTEMCMQRKLSIDDADKSLRMLAQFCSFRGWQEMDKLKEMLEELQRDKNAKTINGNATMPAWGRLSEGSETANKTPAE